MRLESWISDPLDTRLFANPPITHLRPIQITLTTSLHTV